MDDNVIRSMLKWPDVPDVYGWLRLDRRGNWRIRTGNPGLFDPIGNAALREFIGRNYSVDGRGCWFFQNGPQRVFVQVAFAPLVFHLGKGGLFDHCGRPAGAIEGAWLDEEGSLVLRGPNGAGVLDDRDLGVVAEQLAGGMFCAGGAKIQVGSIASRDLEARFGFTRNPQP